MRQGGAPAYNARTSARRISVGASRKGCTKPSPYAAGAHPAVLIGSNPVALEAVRGERKGRGRERVIRAITRTILWQSALDYLRSELREISAIQPDLPKISVFWNMGLRSVMDDLTARIGECVETAKKSVSVARDVSLVCSS